MIEIAGGIVLAVLFLALLPFLLVIAFWLLVAAVYAAVGGAIAGWIVMPALGLGGAENFLAFAVPITLALAWLTLRLVRGPAAKAEPQPASQRRFGSTIVS